MAFKTKQIHNFILFSVFCFFLFGLTNYSPPLSLNPIENVITDDNILKQLNKEIPSVANLNRISCDLPESGSTNELFISGNIAYLAKSETGLVCVNITDPLNPVVLGSYNTPGSAFGVVVIGSIAYVADYGSGVQIINVSNPASPTLIGTYNTGANAIQLVIRNNIAYIAVETQGLFCVNITNLYQPELLSTITSSLYEIFGLTIRDDVAFLAVRNVGLVCYNISNPRNPTFLDSLTLGTSLNVYISGDRAYVANRYTGISIVAIQDPSNLYIIGNYAMAGETWDVSVIGNIAYVANFDNGFTCVDVSTPWNAFQVASCDTPGNAVSLMMSGNFAYIADWSQDLQIVQVATYITPKKIGNYSTGGNGVDVAVDGFMAYIADHTAGGLRIFNMSNPASPILISTCDTPGTAMGVAVSGQIVYIADWDYGLHCIDISNPWTPTIIGTVNTPGNANDVIVIGDIAYVADHVAGLQCINVSNPYVPVLLGSYNTPDYAQRLSIVGNIAFVADTAVSLHAINITNPNNLVLLGSLDLGTYAMDVAVNWPYAYVVDQVQGVWVIDVSNPSSMKLLGSYDTPPTPLGVATDGNLVYIANDQTLQRINATNLYSPSIYDSLDSVSNYAVAICGNIAYMSAYTNGGIMSIKIAKYEWEITPLLQLWNRTFGGAASDVNYRITHDDFGYIYTVGVTSSFGAGSSDALILKYAQDGTLIWNKTWGISSVEDCYGIDTDGTNSLYIFGCGVFGYGAYDFFLLKLDLDGNQIWNRTMGGASNDYGYDVAVSRLNGNVYAAGITQSFGAGGEDGMILAFNSAGIQLWNRTWGGGAFDEFVAIDIDSNDLIYTTGYTASFGAGQDDIGIVKWNSSGNQIWNKTFGTSIHECPFDIEIDPSNNLYIAGYNVSAQSDALLFKMNSDGIHQWNVSWGGSAEEVGSGVALDSKGNIYLSGRTASFGAGSHDAFLRIYASNGSLLSNTTWGGTAYDQSGDVEIDDQDFVYINGYTASFGAGSNDAFLVKYGMYQSPIKSPILIDGNAAFTVSNGVSSGDGTFGNPYIIENWIINASSAHGIEIRNTDKHFYIRNCRIESGISNSKYGIYLFNVTNAIITNNIVANNRFGIYLNGASFNAIINITAMNNDYGILLEYTSNNNTITNITAANNQFGIYLNGANNNTISNNTVSANTNVGIRLVSGSNNNRIWNNNILNNIFYNAFCESSTGNQWSLDKTGNFYGDYSGIYPAATNDGRVWNTPYQIAGAAGDQDLSPLVEWPSILTISNPISINGNTDFASQASANGWLGEGTIGNPYIIQNLIITTSVTNQHAIRIQNTDVYFIIRNCILSATGTTSGAFYPSGIDLEYVTHGKLLNNTIHDGSYYGIYLQYSDNNTIANNTVVSNDYGICLTYSCDNNFVINNTMMSNHIIGIQLNDASYNNIINNTVEFSVNHGILVGDTCNYNNLTYNSVINTTNQGFYFVGTAGNNLINYNNFKNSGIAQAVSESATNIFNFNFWNDHISPDNNLDGIVDTSYSISGAGGLTDSNPKVEWNIYTYESQFINFVPSLTSPVDQSWVVGTIGHSIDWTVTDSSIQASTNYAIWQDSICVQIGTWTTGNIISYSIDGLTEGSYLFELQVNDGFVGGNTSDSILVSVHIKLIPSQIWNRTWGGSSGEIGTDVVADANYVYCIGYGINYSTGGNDMFLFKFDVNGNQIWNRTWGGSSDDAGYSLILSGPIIYCVGVTQSYGAGSVDIVLMKWDTEGNQIWYKTWGNAGYNHISGIVKVDSYLYVYGIDQGVTPSNNTLIKFDINGNQIWNVSVGGVGAEFIEYDSIWSDGSYIYLTGSCQIGGYYEIDLYKYDLDGHLILNSTFQRSANEMEEGIYGYGSSVYICGYSTSLSASQDAILIKYDLNGNQLWNRSWLVSDESSFNSIWIDDTQIYTVGSNNADFFLVCWDHTGNIVFNKTWGGGSSDSIIGIYKNETNLYLIGYTASYGAGGNDAILFKWTVSEFENFVPVLSVPLDQSWNVGSTGHSVSWNVTDTTTLTPRLYSIWQGSTCVQIGTWTTDDVISYTLDGLAINTYIFELQVNDGIVGGNSSDQVSITVLNIFPSLTSPVDQSLVEGITGHSISWTVTDSSTQVPRTYSIWQGSTCIQIGTWTNDDILSIGLDGLSEGSYTFELQVNDGFIGGNNTDFVDVSVGANIVPSLTAPSDQSWDVGTTGHSISWTVTDTTTQAPRSYSIWQGATCVQIGMWTTNDVISYSLDGLAINTYTFELQVNDGIVGGNFSDQVSVSVLNILPSLDVPADQSWEVGTTGHSISWTATDVSTQTPRVFSIWQGATCIATGNWVSGSAIPQNIDGLAQGSYIFEIQVNDGYASGNASDSVSVTVNTNTVPSLTSPADQNRVFGSTGYFISWTATDSSVGTTVYTIYRNGTQVDTNSWVSTVSFSISLDGLSVGVYNYTCVVSDGIGGVSQDEVIITITNVLPTLSTPSDIVYTVGSTGNIILWMPTDTSINGTLMYSVWRGALCLASGTWASGTNIVFNADGYAQGIWIVELRINDGYVGGNASDSVTITVTSNSPPIITSPANQVWLVGTTSHTISWTISDSENSTTSYFIYRNGTLVDSSFWMSGIAINLPIDGLAPGIYNFTIVADDGLPLGQISDECIITVWNHAPQLTSPGDQSWAMNTTNHYVAWSPTDSDFGANVWYNLSRNGVNVIENAVWSYGVAINYSLDYLLPGTYNFTLIISDGYFFNNTNSDFVQINVSNAVPTISHPADITYGNGTIGHQIQWTITDENTMNGTYRVLCDNIVWEVNSWISGQTVNVSVYGLTLGVHNLTIEVNDGFNATGSDLVWVTVFDNRPIAPIVGEILPNPSASGTINLNWSSVSLATNYTVYQYLGLITVLNGSVLKLTTTDQTSYVISNLAEGSYYFVVIASNNSGNSGISNCISVTVAFPELPPQVSILQPTNGSIFLTINNLVLNYYVANIPQIQSVSYMLNSSGQWVTIFGNTTFTALYPGYHSIIVRVQATTGENYTSAPAVFKIVIENDTNAAIEIAMQVISGSFQAGETMEIQVTITNKGAVDLSNLVLYFDRTTSEYQFHPSSSNNYTILSITVDQTKVFTIKIVPTVTTNQITIRGQFTADTYHKEIAFPLKPGSITDPMIYTFSAAGVAAVGGGAFYGLKKKKTKGSKSILGGQPDKHADKNEPSLDKNDDVEFKF